MNKLDTASPSFLTRTLDAIDRGHARSAMRIHDLRNDVLAMLERGIDRLETAGANAIKRARTSIKRADQVSADAVNRAQGAVGHAIERARLSRSTPAHLAS